MRPTNAVVAISLLFSQPATALPSYRITALETIGSPFGSNSAAYAINNSNTIVGHSNYLAVSWKNGKLRQLGVFGNEQPGNRAVAGDINNSGLIVGSSGLIHDPKAVKWANGAVEWIIPVTGSFSGAIAVNDNGVIVGRDGQYGGDIFPVYWKDSLEIQLGTARGVATDINESGKITLNHIPGNRAHISEDDVLRQLTQLPYGDATLVSSINDIGQMVGDSLEYNAGKELHTPVIWEGIVPTSLSSLYGSANDINNNGIVIGKLLPGGRGYHGFVWEEDTGAVLMEDLVVAHDPLLNEFSFFSLFGINDYGLIVGSGYNGATHQALLFTPTDYTPTVPLPPTAWLFGSVVALGMGGLRRKKKHAVGEA